MTVRRGDPALQIRRIRPTTQPLDIVIRLQHDGLGPSHPPQHLRCNFPEVRRERHATLAIRNAQTVSFGIVWNSEESGFETAYPQRIFRRDRSRAHLLAYARTGEDGKAAFTDQGTYTGSVVRMSVCQEHGLHVIQTTPNAPEKTLDTTTGEPGVDENAAGTALDVR